MGGICASMMTGYHGFSSFLIFVSINIAVAHNQPFQGIISVLDYLNLIMFYSVNY